MKLASDEHRVLVLWATDCAEHVLSAFEGAFPEDDRPRRAIDAGRAWARGEVALSAVRAAAFAAHAAARVARAGPACAAARAAGHAAATAHVASHARHAAAYARTAADTDDEQAWQRRGLPEKLRPLGFVADPKRITG